MMGSAETKSDGDEDACGAGQSADAGLVVQDKSCTEKSNALNDIRCYLAFVCARVSGQHGRQQGEESASHTNQQIGAYTGGLGFPLALDADHASESARKQEALDCLIADEILLQVAKVEWRGKDRCTMDRNQACHARIAYSNRSPARCYHRVVAAVEDVGNSTRGKVSVT